MKLTFNIWTDDTTLCVTVFQFLEFWNSIPDPRFQIRLQRSVMEFCGYTTEFSVLRKRTSPSKNAAVPFFYFWKWRHQTEATSCIVHFPLLYSQSSCFHNGENHGNWSPIVQFAKIVFFCVSFVYLTLLLAENLTMLFCISNRLTFSVNTEAIECQNNLF